MRTGEVQQWPTGELLDLVGGNIGRYDQPEVVVSDVFRTETVEQYGCACTMTGIREEPCSTWLTYYLEAGVPTSNSQAQSDTGASGCSG